MKNVFSENDIRAIEHAVNLVNLYEIMLADNISRILTIACEVCGLLDEPMVFHKDWNFANCPDTDGGSILSNFDSSAINVCFNAALPFSMTEIPKAHLTMDDEALRAVYKQMAKAL